MALVERRKWTDDELNLAFVLMDPLLFALMFWRDEFTIPPERIDLPETWRGAQIISREQRIMAEAGADYMLLRDAMPRIAHHSAQKVALRTSRKIAKTLLLESKFFHIALAKTAPGSQEGMFHTPGEMHMGPTRERLDKKLSQIPLFRLMCSKFDKSSGIMNFHNGWTWHFRLEGMSGTGRNMVGLRASAILGDEGDYSAEPAYQERKQTALPGCYEYWGGVPRGVRGIFWRVCNTDEGKGWKVFRFDMRANPIYHVQEEWDRQIKPDYYHHTVQTQVLGRDGEETVSSFPVIPVDVNLPYMIKVFTDEEYVRGGPDLGQWIEFPVKRVQGAEAWLLHMDYGYAPSPSELGISYFRGGVWFTCARLEMRHIDSFRTAEIIHHIDQSVLPQPASLIVVDAHGQGQGVLATLYHDQRFQPYGYGERALDAGFHAPTSVIGQYLHKKCRQRVRATESGWTCDKCGVYINDPGELTEDKIQTKTYLTGQLKDAFSIGAEWLEGGGASWPRGMAVVLGHDAEGIEELSGTTETQGSTGVVRYITPHNAEHITDMYRCLVSGALRYATMQSSPGVADLAEYGWAGVGSEGFDNEWRAPWD